MVFTWSLRLVPYPVGDQCYKTLEPSFDRLAGSRGRLHGAFEHSRGSKVGSDAASWAMILEQGLAFDELRGMKISLEREAQEESSGDSVEINFDRTIIAVYRCVTRMRSRD